MKVFYHTSFIFAVTEMLRVAEKVRMFPLVDLNTDWCSYVDKIIRGFELTVLVSFGFLFLFDKSMYWD